MRRYSKVNADQGEELIRDTVQYLNTHDYQGNHPWLVKFGNEHIISEAQKLASQGKHDLSLEMYDALYKKKESQLSGSVPGSPNRSPAKGGAGAALQTSQELMLIGTGKFGAMIGKAQGFVKKYKHAEALAVLQECAVFPTELLGADSALVVEMHRLRAEVHFQTADYEKAIGKYFVKFVLQISCSFCNRTSLMAIHLLYYIYSLFYVVLCSFVP